MSRQKIDLPTAVDSSPVPVVSFTGTSSNFQASASSNNTALPTNVEGGWVVRIASSEDCYIAFGTGSVAATTSSILFPKGVEYIKVPKGATHIAAVRVAVTGVVSVNNVE